MKKHSLMMPLSGGSSGGGSSFPFATTFLANNISRAQFDLNAKSANITVGSGLTVSSAVAVSTQMDARSDVAITGGKIYYEFTLAALGGSGAIINGGFCDSSYVQNTSALGSETPEHSVAIQIATLFSTWKIQVGNNDTTFATGAPAVGNVVCVALDIGNAAIWARLGAGNWNNSGTANPATNVGGVSLSSWLTGAAPVNIFPCAQLNTGDNATNVSATFNFGATAFAQTPPAGFNI